MTSCQIFPPVITETGPSRDSQLEPCNCCSCPLLMCCGCRVIADDLQCPKSHCSWGGCVTCNFVWQEALANGSRRHSTACPSLPHIEEEEEFNGFAESKVPVLLVCSGQQGGGQFSSVTRICIQLCLTLQPAMTVPTTGELPATGAMAYPHWPQPTLLCKRKKRQRQVIKYSILEKNSYQNGLLRWNLPQRWLRRECCGNMPVLSTMEVKPLLMEMLSELMHLQKRAVEKKNAKPKRQLVMGLREVAQGIRAQRVKIVIIGNKLDESGALDEKLQEILALSSRESVPVFYEFYKRKLGQAIGKISRKRW